MGAVTRIGWLSWKYESTACLRKEKKIRGEAGDIRGKARLGLSVAARIR